MQDTQETQVPSLGWEDPLEEMATHPSILAWSIPWTEELGGLQSMGSQRIRHDWVIKYTGTVTPIFIGTEMKAERDAIFTQEHKAIQW